MKAAVNIARGSAADTLVIKDMPLPEPGPGEVRVRIRTSGLNPSDVKVRSGAQGPMPADEVIVHNDGAGEIDAVGDGVGPHRIGERVWLYNVNRVAGGLTQCTVGTAAEAVCVPERRAIPLPDDISYEVGACLGVPAMTAHRTTLCAGAVAGRTVLVTGGAGAVGELCVQIAAGLGARVIATVSGPEKAEIARAAGAEEVVNYREEPLVERLGQLAPDGIDHAADVDFAAHVDLYPQIMKVGGTVGAYATASDLTPRIPFYPLAFHNITIWPVLVYSMDEGAKAVASGDITQLLTEGKLAPTIAATRPLDDVVAAHQAQEQGGFIGSQVLTL